HAFGIIDNDGRTPIEVTELKPKGLYALSVFSVESIYYAIEIQRRVAERHAELIGGDANARLADAKNAAIAAVTSQAQRLSERVVEKTIRESMLMQLPGRSAIAAGTPINISLDVAALVAAEKSRLETNLANGNLTEIIARYPVRETSALSEIARKLGFQNRDQYEGAFRKLLMDSQEALNV